MKGIGTRIKQVRHEFGMTQREFGKEVGISGNYLSEIETEKKAPSTTLVLAIEYKYGINKEWLIYGKGEKYTKEMVGFSGREKEIIKFFREMPGESKKIFLALLEKLRKK